ncbi:DUF4097 family beta strand repeat-containing protein [Cellulomonas sp. Leaf334]|uniref:DUF4097 family beta strand repeat-containing protein n=1 Tax=Cellulomonas sp. Leaf334 TaxID=1736339 RepID=UPI0006FD3B33|nr:DUF4097 family beta strand repeat-containing protein [Cellulomonas sp. Leaf334]KQR17242.1 hypothetical protein ASF78_08065 [Cellulomonas sp. Leaf334]
MYTFDTPTTISLTLDVPAGGVQLIAADRTDTTVEVRPADASKSRDVKAAEQTVVDLRDGALRISTPVKHQALGPSGSVKVTIQLPAGSRIESHAGAELRGVGRLGDVTVTSSYGPIALDEAATVHLAALDGDITVGRLAGPAEISTAKGDIRVAEAVRGTVVLSTQAGNISIGAATGVTASLDAGTSYGRVRNALTSTGGTPELQIHATTAYGDIAAHTV